MVGEVNSFYVPSLPSTGSIGEGSYFRPRPLFPIRFLFALPLSTLLLRARVFLALSFSRAAFIPLGPWFLFFWTLISSRLSLCLWWQSPPILLSSAEPGNLLIFSIFPLRRVLWVPPRTCSMRLSTSPQFHSRLISSYVRSRVFPQSFAFPEITRIFPHPGSASFFVFRNPGTDLLPISFFSYSKPPSIFLFVSRVEFFLPLA